MKINLKPMFLMSKYSIPEMQKTGEGGSIINISSISATRPKGYTAYSASKVSDFACKSYGRRSWKNGYQS